MKYTNVFSSFACALALASGVNAGVIAGTGIIDGAGGDTMILGMNGGLLSSGIASAGYFTIADSEVSTLASTYMTSGGSNSAAVSSLVAAFVGLANDNFVLGATTSFGSPVPGGYLVNADYGLINAASPLVNKTLYTFFGNGATLGGSDAFGLALHTGVTMTRDDNTPTPDSNDLALSNPYQRLIAGTKLTTVYDATALGGAAGQSASAFQLVGVPEPSTALLGALGALGLLRRRR